MKIRLSARFASATGALASSRRAVRLLILHRSEFVPYAKQAADELVTLGVALAAAFAFTEAAHLLGL